MPRRFPRKVRPREKNVPKGYDSKWEYTLHQTVLKSWNHHTDKIPYVVEHKYEPDFVKDKIKLYNLQYRKPSQEERDEIILKIYKYISPRILNNSLPKS